MDYTLVLMGDGAGACVYHAAWLVAWLESTRFFSRTPLPSITIVAGGMAAIPVILLRSMWKSIVSGKAELSGFRIRARTLFVDTPASKWAEEIDTWTKKAKPIKNFCVKFIASPYSDEPGCRGYRIRPVRGNITYREWVSIMAPSVALSYKASVRGVVVSSPFVCVSRDCLKKTAIHYSFVSPTSDTPEHEDDTAVLSTLANVVVYPYKEDPVTNPGRIGVDHALLSRTCSNVIGDVVEPSEQWAWGLQVARRKLLMRHKPSMRLPVTVYRDDYKKRVQEAEAVMQERRVYTPSDVTRAIGHLYEAREDEKFPTDIDDAGVISTGMCSHSLFCAQPATGRRYWACGMCASSEADAAASDINPDVPEPRWELALEQEDENIPFDSAYRAFTSGLPNYSDLEHATKHAHD